MSHRFDPNKYLRPYIPPSEKQPVAIRCTEDRPGEGLGIQTPAGIYGVGKARFMAAGGETRNGHTPVHIAAARHAERLRASHNYQPNMHDSCAAYLGGVSILHAIATRPEEVLGLARAYMPSLEERHFDPLPGIAAKMLAEGHVIDPYEADPHLLEGVLWEHDDGETYVPPVARKALEADTHAALVGATIMHLPQPDGVPLSIQLIGHGS